MKNLGLVGGLGPGATLYYYRELSRIGAGEFLMVQADVAYVLDQAGRGNRQALADYLARLIERLARGGAEVAAISAITPHICIRELERISALPLVNVLDGIAAEIRSRGYGRVALFGTRSVVASRLFDMLEGVDVFVPVADQVDAIHDAYTGLLGGDISQRDVFSRIAHELPVDAVVFAGTDLTLVFDETNTDFPHVDGAKVHIDAIVRRLMHSDAMAH
jgi:aspartate racemase